MKIAYFARIDVDRPSGVLKKILRQISYWSSQGHEVNLFSLSRPFQEPWSKLEKYSVKSWQTKNYFDLMAKSILAEKEIAKWKPDLIFWRYSSYYPFMNRILTNRFPVVIDVNSNYDYEYKRIHSRFGYLFHLYTKDYAFWNVSGFTTLTNELASWLGKYKKPVAIIGDNINFEEISPLPVVINEFPQIFCFASKSFPWIALDKIAYLAKQFPSWQIDIIGLDHKNILDFPIPANMIFHGFLPGEKYRKILEKTDVALGTLGLHRIGLNEMAPLKLREYLAHGLPAIIGYQDTDFPKPVDFLLQLPNKEENIQESLEVIRVFVEKWMGKRVPRDQISHLGVNVKEQKRLEFFERIVSNEI